MARIATSAQAFVRFVHSRRPHRSRSPFFSAIPQNNRAGVRGVTTFRPPHSVFQKFLTKCGLRGHERSGRAAAPNPFGPSTPGGGPLLYAAVDDPGDWLISFCMLGGWRQRSSRFPQSTAGQIRRTSRARTGCEPGSPVIGSGLRSRSVEVSGDFCAGIMCLGLRFLLSPRHSRGNIALRVPSTP